MSSYPMYVLMAEEDYKNAVDNLETVNNLGPYEDDLVEENDFIANFGQGYVSYKRIFDDARKQAEAAGELVRFYGEDICHTDGNVLVFEADAPRKYAAKQLKAIHAILEGMTPEKYLDTGEYLLRTTIRTDACFVHTYEWEEGYVDDEYVQSADRFLIHTLADNPRRRFVVTQELGCHD